MKGTLRQKAKKKKTIQMTTFQPFNYLCMNENTLLHRPGSLALQSYCEPCDLTSVNCDIKLTNNK